MTNPPGYVRKEDMLEYYWGWREIEMPCKKCNGSGKYVYANCTTWRHGAGGQAITTDVCDECWGSGDGNKPWPSWKDRK